MDFLTDIPNCELKEVFIQKLQAESEKFANLYSELHNISVQISSELRQINELFPEYTPHDKDYHISHLFRIADIILSKCRYDKMNAVELYLLIVSMYAHDWGMAVSKSERYYIATGKKIDHSESINLLDDEREKFEEFKNWKLGKTDLQNDDEMQLVYWQDYIRDTHALRSAKRIQNYYQNINNSISVALYKICVGHWLDIEDISDRNGYYVDSSVYGETVNLRALTVYIRLIDLFDLAEDRTPYVIWKYVNPQNIYSRMEWSKHRALHQITCPKYESGRVVCISGSTDDHEVYAALMDFKILCEKYFRECSDLLAHMKNPKYELGVYFLDWRIEARNFKPIEVQFNFESGNIFEILSQEIYNCHPYVYIRELVQNSVDAISLRKEILDRKKVGGNNIGYIDIEVNDISDNDIQIVCKDDGIGMDQHVLCNYFAVLGKSYYQSADFKNRRLDMSPISKFGIGILSCFAIASQMKIYTAREPYLGEGREGLKVIINDIKKQFRVEEVPGYNNEIGTKIILKIRKDILIQHLKKNKMELDDFNITDYIKDVFGFIPYPILIKERNKKTIIVHPEYNEKKLYNLNHDIDERQVHKISCEYPVKEIVPIQDIDNFNKVFETRKFDIKQNLKMEDIEGYVIFSILRDYNDNINNLSHCWPAREISVDRKNGDIFRIRWIKKDEIKSYNTTVRECGTIKIFSRGFLLEKEDIDKFDFRYSSNIFPAPIIKLNYQKGIENISVSRFENKDENDILNKIWNEIGKIISIELKDLSKEKSCYELWKIISVYCAQYKIDISNLSQDIFNEVKFPFINNNGKLTFDYIREIDEIFMLPQSKESISNIVFNNRDFLFEIKKWNYGKCLIGKRTTYFFTTESINVSIPSYVYNAVIQRYCLKKANILNGGELDYPDIQYVLCKEETNYSLKKIFEMIECFGVNYEQDFKKISKIFKQIIESDTLVEFDNDHSKYLAYGFRNFNICHPMIKLLIQYKWLLSDVRDKSGVDKKEWAIKNDLYQDNSLFNRYYDDDEEKEKYCFDMINSNIEEVHKWLSTYYKDITTSTFNISEKDFIPNSIEILDSQNFLRIKEVEQN